MTGNKKHIKKWHILPWYCIVFLGFFLMLGSCKKLPEKPTLFQLMDSTGINFNNIVADSGAENNCFRFRNFYNGGGVGLGDLNNDGLPDVVLTSNLGNNKIYINKGNFHFVDTTATSGLVQNGQWSTGVSLVDINNDGWLDIYICNSGHVLSGNRKNQLYINNHDCTFTEAAAKYGLDHVGYSTQAAFFDYDGDGDLDCFIIDNSPIPFGTLNFGNMRDSAESAWKVPDNYKGGGNHLYQNNSGHFTEVTKQAGLHTSLLSFGLGISVADVNGDGWPDVYVGNDFLERDYLYINQKNGTFKDELEDHFQHISMSSMGTDVADMNNDGLPDIYTTDMMPADDYRLKTTGTFDNVDLYRSKVKSGFYQQYVRNCLQINNGAGNFCDVANYTGTAKTDWSWGLDLCDMDNDGYNDIFVCSGINHDLANLDFLDFFSNNTFRQNMLAGSKDAFVDSLIKKIPQTPLSNKTFRNLGNLQFEDVGNRWGLGKPSFSNSVAYADLDNDGDLDLVVNNENRPAFVYQNHARDQNKNNFISISLKGDTNNTFAIGTTLKVYANNQIFYRENQPVRGFQSCVDSKLIIGLGKIDKIDSMIVMWPNHTLSAYFNPAINVLHTIYQKDGKVRNDQTKKEPTLFTKVDAPFDKHQEDDFVDFYYERNIPQMLSRQGPNAAIGDVDGDGLEDIYIGGAAGQAGQLYLQTKGGGFVKKTEVVFDRFAGFEDVAVLFFDADHDGDLDLVIGPGGNSKPATSMEMQLRLYKNDGKGNFSFDAGAFTNIGSNISTIVACDFDHDGDLDLFVGGRCLPGQYGATPESYIFSNDGKGHFTNVTTAIAPAIAHVGMVTGAVWANMVANENDLVVVGEWMSPKVFAYRNGYFVALQTNLDSLHGWWQSVAAEDLDGDGKTDLVLGNIGENFYLHPTSQNPVKLWMQDFDKNGSIEKIMTQTIAGNDMPVFLKHEMEEQLPILKKQNLLHEGYAKKSIQDLFSPETLASCEVKRFDYAPSCIAINQGNGHFTVTKLPPQVQFSSVNAILPIDPTKKGLPNLLLGGNLLGFLPQFGRLDANFGLYLKNNGSGKFTSIDARKTGLLVRGETRDIKQINVKKNNCFVFLRNNEFPVMYQLTQLNP